jgi:hypothetical protein
MKITREFAPADRYLYDFKVCTTDKGWAQLDTRQDASYFGTWINPTARKIFCYCEGDTTLTECETDAELQAELATMAAWNAENGYRAFSTGKAIAIDPGFNDDLKAACVAAGIGGYLH